MLRRRRGAPPGRRCPGPEACRRPCRRAGRCRRTTTIRTPTMTPTMVMFRVLMNDEPPPPSGGPDRLAALVPGAVEAVLALGGATLLARGLGGGLLAAQGGPPVRAQGQVGSVIVRRIGTPRHCGADRPGRPRGQRPRAPSPRSACATVDAAGPARRWLQMILCLIWNPQTPRSVRRPAAHPPAGTPTRTTTTDELDPAPRPRARGRLAERRDGRLRRPDRRSST